MAFTTSEVSTDITPRLTRAALAYHNREQASPPRRQGPASESELNTLIEMENNLRKTSPTREAGSRPKHRRTSSSSPVRLKNGRVDSFKHQRTSSTPIKQNNNRMVQNENTEDLSRFRFDRYQKESQESHNALSPQGRPPLRPLTRNGGERTDIGASEISAAQSRFSITDYFKKYHSSQQTAGSELRSRPPTGRLFDSKEMYDRGQSAGRLDPGFRKPSDIDDRTLRSDGERSRNIKQRTLFKGTNYDTTISAIHDDDNVSSVSMNSVSTANTTDDKKFRNGIAMLDANIAKLQMALQKTKSMLS